ncbi:peptidoglycan-binding protein [Hirschia litorea]|uniref:Peptidoglycan-binding protein n=1 Tax=Hirschia litorea TaxID=1199156 RepID=A0ABW2IJP0_9PROT
MGNAPWSVKGIDPKARAKAREHAQRDGITLGSYLNRLLLEDSGESDTEQSYSPLNPIMRGEAGAERVSEVAETLEEIARRMNAGENRSTQALAGVDQSMLTLLNRLESTERTQAGMSTRFDSALNDMRTTHASLEERLDSLSRKDNSRRMLDAMRALEGALTKLAKQVHDTQDQVTNEQDALRNDVERGVSHLSKEVDNISRRVDDSVSDATKRLGREFTDRLGSMESRLSETTRKQDESLSRIDRVERNTDDRLRDVLGRTENALDVARAQSRKSEERFTTLEDRLNNTHRTAENALKSSQSSFNDLRDSLKSFASHTDAKLDEALNTADSAMSIAQRQATETSDEINRRNKELADKLFGSISDVEERLSSAQQNVTSMFAKVSDVSNRVEKAEQSGKSSEDALATLQAAMERINDRFTAAEESKANAISTLEKSYSSLDERLDEVQEKVGETSNLRTEFEEKLSAIADNFSKSIEDTRARTEEIVSQNNNVQPAALESLQQQMEIVQADIAAAEDRQLQAVELITSQFERLSEALDERLRSVEERNPSESIANELRQELNNVTDTINNRLQSIESGKNAQMGPLADQISKIAAHMEERLNDTNEKIDENQRRSAEAIEQVGEHVARATERLQARNEDAFENIYDKIDEVSQETRTHVSSAMEDIERRLQEAREESARIVSPVQNTVSSLAQRLEDMSPQSDDEAEFDAGIAPPPLPKSDKETSDVSLDGFDTFIEDDDLEVDADDSEMLSDLEESQSDAASIFDDSLVEDIAAPPVFEDEYITSVQEDNSADAQSATLKDEDIADLAYNARREFAAELAEQRAQLEEEAELFRQNDEATDAFTDEESTSAPAHKFGDSDTDAFTSSLELEYEADLPPESAAYHMRSDEGLDDDPFGRASNNSSDFLNEARRAAKERGADNRAAISGNEDRKNSKLPMVAAGVLAAAVVGGAGMMAMRGKQVNSDEAFSVTPPKFNPDASDANAFSEDEDTLFDASEEALDTQASLNSTDLVDDETGAQIDEQLLFPEDAKILTSENIREANPQEATPTSAPSKRVSPLDAFASSRTNAAEAPAPAAVTLESAAEAGSPIALHELAIKQLAAGEKKVAAETMRKAADQGLAAAQYRMGKLYERGEGVPRSIKESRKWTKLSAENGNVKAMHDLAVFYAEGEGGEQSFVGGVEWFTRAAEHGLIDSQYNLGVLYEQGLGVSADPAKAAYWFEIAGRNGDADGSRRARDILKNLSPAEARNVTSKVDNFIPRAVNGIANGRFGAQAWNAPVKTQIAEAQRLLSRITGTQLSADGIMGPQTREAIRTFEMQNGFEPTGDISDSLMQQLRSVASSGI